MLVAATTLVGCRTSRNIVGVWESDGAITRELKLNEDGTLEYEMSFGAMNGKLTGEYKIDRNRIVLDKLGAKAGGITMKELPPMVSEMAQGEHGATFSWKTDDEILISGGMLDGAYKRVKN
jgi:hypothetical protein